MTLDLAMIFLSMIPKAQTTNIQIDQWDYLKFKYFSASMVTVSRGKRQPMDCEKTAYHISDIWGIISRIYKEVLQVNK